MANEVAKKWRVEQGKAVFHPLIPVHTGIQVQRLVLQASRLMTWVPVCTGTSGTKALTCRGRGPSAVAGGSRPC